MPRTITLLGYWEGKFLERGHPYEALVFLIVEIVRPFEQVPHLFGRKEGSSMSPVTTAHRDFFGSRPLSRADELPARQGARPVGRRLP
ncbi:hypothetical protein [Streptomyces sp. NPDC058595]|uniref:hypothetical protein n=1 Tax=Streptomyces sp. NPDC058595 TaxID=3346550 RepID=UPI0036646FB0